VAGRPIALIHSPLVGPATWTLVAEALRSSGHRVATPAASAWGVERADDAGLGARIVDQLAPARSERWALVGHSGAGGLLPAIADAGLDVAAALFVDAVLPHPGQSWLETAPPALRAEVLNSAREAHAAPWPEWFAPALLERLLPDRAMREAFAAECEPIPLDYLTAPSPRPSAWPPAACAYLQLSDGYDAETEAAARHWPVERLPLHHLAMLTEPAKVAAAIERMLAAIP